jgi:hypothetical protein
MSAGGTQCFDMLCASFLWLKDRAFQKLFEEGHGDHAERSFEGGSADSFQSAM